MSSPPFLLVGELLSKPEEPVNWLVPDFLAAGSFVAFAGEAGAGKSTVAYALSLALATGSRFLGWDLKPARVLYLDEENSLPDSKKYWRWAWNGLGRPDTAVIDENLKLAHFLLGTKYWYERLGEMVLAVKPDLIVIDTTTPVCNVQDENNNAEATEVITKLRRIARLSDPVASILALKHARLLPDGGGYTMRGAKAWLGAVDSVLFQTKLPGRPLRGGLHRTKIWPNKVRAYGLREHFKITPTKLGEGDSEGIILTKELLADEDLQENQQDSPENDNSESKSDVGIKYRKRKPRSDKGFRRN